MVILSAAKDLIHMRLSYYTYIATNIHNSVLYTGITNNLQRRMYEHSHRLVQGFTSKYNVHKLVWFEEFSSPEDAISAEKKIKGWLRSKKIDLIKRMNPSFKDLMQSEEILHDVQNDKNGND